MHTLVSHRNVHGSSIAHLGILCANKWIMNVKPSKAKLIVGAIAATVMISIPFEVFSGENRLEGLLQSLQSAESGEAKRISREIRLEWSKSGSPAMDLLLKRGREDLERKEFGAAISHLSALIDHAPDFAEGWHARATANFKSDHLGRAMADLEQALMLNPQHFGAIYGLAVIFEQLGRLDEAYDGYSAVLDVFPMHGKSLQALERLEEMVNGVML